MIVIEFKEMHLLSLSKCVTKSQYVTKMLSRQLQTSVCRITWPIEGRLLRFINRLQVLIYRLHGFLDLRLETHSDGEDGDFCWPREASHREGSHYLGPSLFNWGPQPHVGPATEGVACAKAGSSKGVLDVQEPKTNSKPHVWVLGVSGSTCPCCIFKQLHCSLGSEDIPPTVTMYAFIPHNTRRENMDGQWTVPKAAYSCCSLFLKQEVIYATESSRGVNRKVLCVR